MDLIALQRAIKFFTDDNLQREMTQPSGSVPSYLVLAEINRRKEMREKGGKAPKSTVKDDMTKIPMMDQIPVGVPQLKRGGIVQFQDGGRVNRPTPEYEIQWPGTNPKYDFSPGWTAPGIDGLPNVEGYDYGTSPGDSPMGSLPGDPKPGPRGEYPPGTDRGDSVTRWARRQFWGPNSYDTSAGSSKAQQYLNEARRKAALREFGSTWEAVPPDYTNRSESDPDTNSPTNVPDSTDNPQIKGRPTTPPGLRGTPGTRSGTPSTGTPGRGIASSFDQTFDRFMQKYANKDDPYAEVRSRLAEIEAERRGRKGDSLNEALIQGGFALAASKSPYLGQAMGEAGLAGLKTYQASRKDMREEEMAHLGANAKLVEAKVAYDRGEFDKAFKLMQEHNIEKYRAQALAQRGAASGNKDDMWRYVIAAATKGTERAEASLNGASGFMMIDAAKKEIAAKRGIKPDQVDELEARQHIIRRAEDEAANRMSRMIQRFGSPKVKNGIATYGDEEKPDPYKIR